MIRVKKIYMSVHVEMVDRETQASQWLDHHFLTRYEEQIWEMENECFSKETYIDELEAQVERMKESLEDFLKEREIAEKYSSKLERRLHQLRMTQAGKVLHFSIMCPHFARAQQVRQWHVWSD